jgi:hypothetical protein
MKCSVVLHLNPLIDLFHSSKVFSGLHTLARRGVVHLRVEPAWYEGYCPLLDVRAADGRSRRVAIDLADHSNRFSRELLAGCDVYYKRSFHAPDNVPLRPDLRARVVPFGLNHCTATGSSKAFYFGHWARAALRHPFAVLRRYRDIKEPFRSFLQATDPASFEQSPDAAVRPVILYQTRVWEPEASSDDLEAVNEERVSLVRRLRQAFGERFQGGIVPTAYARRRYPDVLLARAYRQKDYARQCAESLMGVYTRGLHHSLAFKLSEYLAASMCVVSCPLRNELPAPLQAGRHYHEFGAHEECLAHCERLLKNPDEAREMRRANHAYYRQWVEPAEHVRYLLERAVR